MRGHSLLDLFEILDVAEAYTASANDHRQQKHFAAGVTGGRCHVDQREVSLKFVSSTILLANACAPVPCSAVLIFRFSTWALPARGVPRRGSAAFLALGPCDKFVLAT